MKIRVRHNDGTTEVLDLKGPITVTEGKFMNRLTDGSGVDHFFSHDGFYDGWVAAVRDDEQSETSGDKRATA